jgi:hypothetical protein
MRKMMLSLVTLGGVAGAAAAAQAAPIRTAPPVLDNPAQVRTVQYYYGHGPKWRAHENWRNRRYEALRWHHWPHGRAYGYYYR